jgi:hypothetical protein
MWDSCGDYGLRAKRHRSVALLAILGLLATVTLGTLHERLDLSGAIGVPAATLSGDASQESTPADRAQASASIDVGPVALPTIEPVPPPGGGTLSYRTFFMDRCRPGHLRGIEHPPRFDV